MASRAKTCEWMFGDAGSGILGFHALADINPLRWSGPLSFDECIKQLEKVSHHGTRPITVKVPAGVASKENKLSGVDDAIEFVKSRDPDRRNAREQLELAEAQVLECEEMLENAKGEEARTAGELQAKRDQTGAGKSIMTMWMYSNPDSPLGGLGRFFAQFNPVRWSDLQTAASTINDMKGLEKHHAEHNEPPRGIKIRIGDAEPETIDNEQLVIEKLSAMIDIDDPELHKLEDAEALAKDKVENAQTNLNEAIEERDKKKAAAEAAGV